MPVEVFPFRYRDPRTGRWIVARYRATSDDIAVRYAKWEIAGPAETRTPFDDAFHPYRTLGDLELRRMNEPGLEVNPHLTSPPTVDADECVLALLFLLRYVTYCACRRRFAQMEGAAHLHREITCVRRAMTRAKDECE